MKATRNIVIELEESEAYALYKILGNIKTCDFTDVYKLTAIEVDTILCLIDELPPESGDDE